jgi:glc operon protein GlcG
MRLFVSALLALHVVLGLVATARGADLALPTAPVLDLATAKRAAAGAEADAAKRGLGVVIAVVDAGGTPILLQRMDSAQVASVEVAIGKARTAAIFRRPSKVFEDQIRDGRVAALALPGATPLQGGLPIAHGGRVVGAIGISGDSPQIDEDIARAGLAALE